MTDFYNVVGMEQVQRQLFEIATAIDKADQRLYPNFTVGYTTSSPFRLTA
jgi:hypothetical protein